MILTDEKIWTTKEIAALFRVTDQTVRNYINKGELKAIRFGDSLRVTDSALKEFLEKQNKPQERA